MSEQPKPGEKTPWFDNRTNIDRMYGILWAFCIALVVNLLNLP